VKNPLVRGTIWCPRGELRTNHTHRPTWLNSGFYTAERSPTPTRSCAWPAPKPGEFSERGRADIGGIVERCARRRTSASPMCSSDSHSSTLAPSIAQLACEHGRGVLGDGAERDDVGGGGHPGDA
jgi:hypothetical protein